MCVCVHAPVFVSMSYGMVRKSMEGRKKLVEIRSLLLPHRSWRPTQVIRLGYRVY